MHALMLESQKVAHFPPQAAPNQRRNDMLSLVMESPYVLFISLCLCPAAGLALW
jgi:hypothetical protein